MKRRIGTVQDAAERYGTDVAEVWWWIAQEVPVESPDGGLVLLVAPPDERVHSPRVVSDEPTLWIVSEVPA